MGVHIVIPTSVRVPDAVLDRAIAHAAAAGDGVQVALPVVLPAALPINAVPPRLLKKIEHQRAVVHRALARAGHRGRVDVIQCHSIAALARTLCAERDPAEQVADCAARTLGRDHPVVRTQLAIGTVSGQARACLGLALAATVLVPFSPPAALTLAVAGAVGALTLAALIAALERLRRQRIDEAILAGQTAPVAIFEEERQRLSGRQAAVMAKALARALHSAVHWREIPPPLRPVHGIRLLEPYRDQVTAIIDGLRRPEVPPEAVI